MCPHATIHYYFFYITIFSTGAIGEEEFYRVMKYKGAQPLDLSSDED
jgi:hypothetical protein